MNFQAGQVSRRRSTAANGMEWGDDDVNNGYTSLIQDIDPKSGVVMDTSIVPVLDTEELGYGSSQKESTTLLSQKPRKKTMTSVFLKYFEVAPDGKRRQCKFCGQSYSIATATGNLGRHLSHRHPGYDKVENVSNLVIRSQSDSESKKLRAEVNEPLTELDHFNWLVIKWLIESRLSPSTLNDKWLVNSFKFLNPMVQLWSGERFVAVLDEVYRSMKEDVRTMIDQVSSKISITLDFWNSYEQFLYMSVTCQWIDENWSYQEVLLDVCHVPCPCGKPEIYPTLMKILKFYQINNRVLSCTHDNSTLKDDTDSQKAGPFCYIPCAAQTLNSIINDGLVSTKSIISKVRELVVGMNSSSQISEDFVKLSAAYQEGSWKFPLDTSQRWSGNYQMLDIARKARKSMNALIVKYEATLGTGILLTMPEKNVVMTMHAYLEPFYKTITNIQTTDVLTIGLVLFFMDHISETIAACRDSLHNPDWLKLAAQEMAVKSQNYNDQICNVFSYMTAILDPRIKVELIPESLNSKNYLEETRTHFRINYSSSSSSSHSQFISNPSYDDSAVVVTELEDECPLSFAEEIARKKRKATTPTTTDELSQYLSESPASLATDVLDWWKANSIRYPRLSMMARDFLAVKPIAVSPEVIFCSKGDEIERQRFSLPYSSTTSILCVGSWMESGMKVKYKSSEIDFEKIMEMADSAAAKSGITTSLDRKQKI